MSIIVYNDDKPYKRPKPMHAGEEASFESPDAKLFLRCFCIIAVTAMIAGITYWQYKRWFSAPTAEKPHQHTFGKWGEVQENWYKPYQLRFCTECGWAEQHEISK